MTGRARTLALVLLVWALVPQIGEAAGRAITLRTAEGRSVNALLTEARDRNAPAVVLVPMLGRTKEDWNSVADRLAEAGIHALAIDLPSPTLPGDGSLSGWAQDISTAVMYLVTRPEGRASTVGLLGASLGANLAVLAAAGDGYVQSLALLSPTLDYRGVRIEGAFRQYGARPALLVASLSDPYAARSVRVLTERSTTTHEVQWSEAAAHGTLLLSSDPALSGHLVDWFRRTLGLN